jgi:hypothetical protein
VPRDKWMDGWMDGWMEGSNTVANAAVDRLGRILPSALLCAAPAHGNATHAPRIELPSHHPIIPFHSISPLDQRTQVGIQGSAQTETAGTVALAYAAHKAASPIRFPPTVALTPFVANAIVSLGPSFRLGCVWRLLAGREREGGGVTRLPIK